MDQAKEEEIRAARGFELKRGWATLLLIVVDHAWYGIMKYQMQQNMAVGTNNYPKSVNETMNILDTFANTNKELVELFQRNESNTEVAFAQNIWMK